MGYTEITLAKAFVELKNEFDEQVHTRTEWKALLKGNGYTTGVIFNRYPSCAVLERYHLLEVCGTEEYTYTRHDDDADVEATGTRELLKLADKLDVRRNHVAMVIAAKTGATKSPEHACEWSVETSPAHREYEDRISALEREYEDRISALEREYEARISALEREYNERKQSYMYRYMDGSKREQELMNSMREFIPYIDYEG